tara:strand:+ start:516 stop:692 length:177 start_codon:yes stop_codon:yes gene_type:complete
MPKKKKNVKNVKVEPTTNHDKIQINIKKDLDEDKKIKPEKVFEGYKTNKKKTTKKKRY